MKLGTIILFLATLSLAASAAPYHKMKWEDAGDYTITKGEHEFLLSKSRVRYIRLRFEPACADVSYQAYAYRLASGGEENVPLIFDRSATESNPKYTAHYWMVRWNEEVALSSLLLQFEKIMKCQVKVALSNGTADSSEPVLPPVYAEGFARAQTEVAAKSIAWQQAQMIAKHQCQTNVVKPIMEKSFCSAAYLGAYYVEGRCWGWFECVKAE